MKYTIKIAVDPSDLTVEEELTDRVRVPPRKATTGNFVYTPALLRVEAGDKVAWTCGSPFTLVFKERTPIDHVEVFSKAVYRTGETIPAGYCTDTFPVNDVKGHFHYAVGVYQNGLVFLDASCPDFSVN
jgi:hypothetical protein